MRKQWKFIMRRGAVGAVLFILSLLPLREAMLTVTLGNKDLDFVWVLAAIALPHVLRGIAIMVISSAVFFALKMLALPRKSIEKSMYALKKRKLVKNVVYAAMAIVPLLFPVKSGTTFAQIIAMVSGTPFYFLAFPLYPLFYMDVLLFAEALLVSLFFVHILRILSLEFATVEPVVGNTVFEEGTPIKFKLRSHSPLPLISFPLLPFKLKGRGLSSMTKSSHEIEVEGKLPVGYYRFDVLKYDIASMPFFFSTFFKATSKPIEITVLPKIKVKNVLYAKNPFIVRETGDLIKKVSGSSLEFAGIKDFSPGDPLSKIWWKGLAKGGKMLKKDFFSLAEDRWILLVDMSDPETKKEDEEAILKFCRGFIEIFTRKDVEISMHLISPNYVFVDYSSNKRALLSFLIRHWSAFRHLSHEGAKLVLKDAVGKSADDVERRCRKSGISLSSFLFYSGLLKEPKKFFQWRRKSSFRDSVLEVTKNLKKSGKMLVVTPGMEEWMVDEMKKVARTKRCSLLFTSFEKVPKTRSYVISRKNPERAAWRLMYV